MTLNMHHFQHYHIFLLL